MTVLSDNSFQALEESLRGELIQPDDQRYDTARKLYNGMIDRYPINRAAHDVGPKDTAFSYREATWAEKIVGVVGITSAPMTVLTTSRAAQANSAETGLGFRRTGRIFHKFCASNYHPLSIEPCARERGMPPQVFISHSSKDSVVADAICRQLESSDIPCWMAPRNIEYGYALGVANVLEGTVRREGDRVRVSARLVDARSDNAVWADSYDRDLNDIFAIQSEVAQTIAGKLSAALSPEEAQRIEKTD
jgi:hypothetical protein